MRVIRIGDLGGGRSRREGLRGDHAAGIVSEQARIQVRTVVVSALLPTERSCSAADPATGTVGATAIVTLAVALAIAASIAAVVAFRLAASVAAGNLAVGIAQ